jgi:hypothetical protein
MVSDESFRDPSTQQREREITFKVETGEYRERERATGHRRYVVGRQASKYNKVWTLRWRWHSESDPNRPKLSIVADEAEDRRGGDSGVASAAYMWTLMWTFKASITGRCAALSLSAIYSSKATLLDSQKCFTDGILATWHFRVYALAEVDMLTMSAQGITSLSDPDGLTDHRTRTKCSNNHNQMSTYVNST